MSVVEYLSENCEEEKELAKGRYIADYDRRITYPVGIHIYFDGQIYEVIRFISGYRKPATVVYWEELIDINIDASQVPAFSQFNTYLSRRQDKLQWRDLSMAIRERLQVRW